MKVGILNAYDVRNLGDQAIVQCTIEWCRQMFPGCEIAVFSHHFETNREIFGELSRRPLLWLPPEGSFLQRLVTPFWDLLLYWARLKSASQVADFVACDYYVLCGGGYLYSSRAPLISRNLFVACLMGVLAARTGKPVVLFPQSVGPFNKLLDRLSVRWLCSSIKHLMAREADSLRQLLTWGYGAKTDLVPDIVFAMKSLLPFLYPTGSTPRKGLGIAPINFSFVPHLNEKDLPEYLQKLANVGEAFHRETGEPVRLYLQVGLKQHDNDLKALQPLKEDLERRKVAVEVVDSEGDLPSYLKRVSENRVFIGCRMHACIFALTTNTPTIGLAYQPKFYGTFGALGLNDWVRPIDDWDETWMENLIREGRDPNQKWSSVIIDKIAAVQEAILGNLMHARQLWQFPPSLQPSSVDFTVVTPSYNQTNWLNLCIASIRDQEGVKIEHIIQDAGSTGFENSVQLGSTESYRQRLYVETDSGMYDAINRGFRKGEGEFFAWLNCDEQYLPGALKAVADYFHNHPDVDVLFGDAILLDEKGALISYRRTILPSLLHIQLSHLNVLSCATFVRRRVLAKGFLLDPSWKAIADAIWIRNLLKAKLKMAVLRRPLSAFTITRSNLGQTSLAKAEMLKFQSDSWFPILWLREPVILWHRVKKFLAGAYGSRQFTTAIYSFASHERRSTVFAHSLPFSWPGQGNPGVAENLAPKESTVVGTMVLSVIVVALIRLIDMQFSGVTLTPLFALTYLLILAFFVDPLCTAAAAAICSVAVLAAFSNYGNILPREKASYAFVTLRMLGFVVAAGSAVLFSHMRVRAKLVTSQLSSIVREIPAPLIVSDATGSITFANREALNILTLDQENLNGRKWPALMMTDRDEGTASRFYIDFFAKSVNSAQDVDLYIDPNKPVPARLICLGGGRSKQLITVLRPT